MRQNWKTLQEEEGEIHGQNWTFQSDCQQLVELTEKKESTWILLVNLICCIIQGFMPPELQTTHSFHVHIKDMLNLIIPLLRSKVNKF